MGRRKITIPLEENENLEVQTTKKETASEADNTESIESSVSGIDQYTKDIDELDNIIKGSKKENTTETETKKRGRKSNEEKQKAALIIPGSLFVRVHNYVGAGALSLLDSYISKKNPIPAEMLTLEEKIIQELAPLAELAMKEMKVEENPVGAFYLSFGALMVSQFMNLKAMIKTAQKDNPDFDFSKLVEEKNKK
jgi:hypothetical protein